jgi:oxygen-independent coproporphyrinogen-3 oxidase
LGAARLEKLFLFLKSLCLATHCEITLEVNPESLDEALIAAFMEKCSKLGVSRLSVGVQSLDDAVRKKVGRCGSAAMVREKLALLKLACSTQRQGFEFSADLISGLPGQSTDSLLKDIADVIAFGAAHISLYDLTVAKETALARSGWIKNEENAALMWLAGRDALVSAGFEQYEVSNFCRNGKRSAHNIRYWLMESWLGSGAGASGTIIDDNAGTGVRWTIPQMAVSEVSNLAEKSNFPRFPPRLNILAARNCLKKPC